MRTLITAAIGAVVLAATPAAAGSRESLPPEARLAKAIEGRVQGKPVDCLFQHDIRSTQIIDRTAIIYDVGGGKLYVNRPDSGENFLRNGDVMVTNTHSDQLCSVDIVRMFDNSLWMQVGTIGLGKFVPYTKAKDTGSRG